MFATGVALACLVSALFAPSAFGASPSQVALTVKQAIASDGSSAPPSEIFAYLLKPESPSNPLPSGSDSDGYAFSITGNVDFTTAPITFSAEGIYNYSLSCVTADGGGFTVDREVYKIEVHVLSDLTALSVVYKSDGFKVPDISFSHSYKTQASDLGTMSDPPVVKTVQGKPMKGDTFTFRLTPELPSNPMPAGSKGGFKEISIVGAGQNEFGKWSYYSAGTYRYTVTEVNTGIKGYKYDTEAYRIEDIVAAVDGKLVVKRTITNNSGLEVSDYRFVNVYKGTPGELTLIAGMKTWNYGSAPASDRPSSIRVLFKNGRTTVREIAVTAAESWRWSVELPSYDSAGNKINYTVEEANVPHYTHTVNGYNITNTYAGKSYPGDNPPKTGDSSDTALWMYMLAASAVVLALMLLWRRRAAKDQAERQS